MVAGVFVYAPQEVAMATKLYIGNLSYEVTQADLQELFAEVGTVESANVIMDRDSGRSKGFGFVEMGSGEEAQAAIKQYDGYDLKGRALKVNEARPREDRSGGRSDSGGRRERRW
jgi:RNA recognition motif-containing protein